MKIISLLSFSIIMASLTSCFSDEGAVFDEQLAKSSEVFVSSNITSNTTWEAGREYILKGRIYVTNGAVLTIEPGVVIKGASGTGTNSKALIVDRNAKIMAEGTAESPIIFTTTADYITSADVLAGNTMSPNLSESANGLWGGLIILGNAPIEASSDELQIEGIPTSESAIYGGDNPADNSGVLRYVSIRHGGANIGSGNEINGLTLGGVGNGTIIENIEIIANADDGIEWFGGTVNVTNAIVWNCGDDAFDTDQGWAGTLNNFIALNSGGNGLELDGAEDDDSGTSRHTLINGLVFNPGGLSAQLDNDSRVNLTNILFDGLKSTSNGIDRGIVANVTFNNVFFNVEEGTLNDYFANGTAPNGVAVGFTNTVNTSAFSGGWSWVGIEKSY